MHFAYNHSVENHIKMYHFNFQKCELEHNRASMNICCKNETLKLIFTHCVFRQSVANCSRHSFVFIINIL